MHAPDSRIGNATIIISVFISVIDIVIAVTLIINIVGFGLKVLPQQEWIVWQQHHDYAKQQNLATEL